MIDKLRAASREFRTRSALVRAAIRKYAIYLQKREEEERERAIIHENRDRLAKELNALIEAQAAA